MTLGMRAALMVEHLDLSAATDDPGAGWEAYQLAFLSDDAMFNTSRKARQIGWSFTAACDAVAAGILQPRTTSIFVSINMEETTEKIVYAKAIVDALDPSIRPTVVDDNATTVRFANGSRILSHPCKPVRGKARARVYLDEFAHYAKDRAIYASAVPVTTRGGVIRIGSTPMGAVGMFWEITSQRLRRYPGYNRLYLPWWTVRALCTDVVRATAEAATMTTEERVARFGTERLKVIFENMVLEDFQQEYECNWVDENVSFIPWEEIKRAQAPSQEGEFYCEVARNVPDAMAAIDRLAKAVKDKQVEAVMCGGMDIGRRKDTTETFVLGMTPDKRLICRLMVTLDRVPFDDQLVVAEHAITALPMMKFCPDETGIGMMLAEKLQKKFWGKVEPITFTHQSRGLMAVEAKVRFQAGTILIPADRDLANQIHSVRRIVLPSKTLTFDVSRSERHHADKFWGLALACLAGKQVRGGFFR